MTVERLHTSPPAVLALGGGALGSSQVRDALRERAFTVHVEVDPGEAWSRVRDAGRPLAQDELDFRALFTKRAPVYARGGGRDRERGRRGRPRGRGGPRRGRLARSPRRARAGRRRRARQRRAGRRDPRRRRAGRARRSPRLGARASGRRGGEDDGRGRCALAGAPPRPYRRARRARRRLHDGRGRVRGGDLPPRHPLGRGPDDARRPGRRGDRRQDRDRPRRGEEPRRRVPLACAHRDRSRPCSRRCPSASVARAWPRS